MAANGVRVRLTAAAVIVVGVALAAGAVALVAVLSTTLTGEVRAAARQRAEQVAAALEAGRDRPLAADAGEDEELVQVLDRRGGVVTASANVAGRPPVARLRPGESTKIRTPLDDDEFMAVAVAAEPEDNDRPEGGEDTEDAEAAGRPVTVIVARDLADVLESTAIVTRSLIVGLPVLLALLTLLTWKLVGRALAPVDAIRAEVDEISAAELHRRVPEPRAGDEIGRLAATMNKMLDRLERAQAGQRRFVSDASHELRSPVAAIRQHAEVALAHPDRMAPAELAATVLAENLRVQRLIDDLLLLARADEDALTPHRAPVDLDDLVFEEASRLRSGTALRVDTAAVSAGRVDGDAGALRRVLRNLGDNAARYATGRVAFTLAEEAGVVRLTVEDDGPGVPEAERERAFERFVRLDGAARARDDGGSGLGLAIVAEVVRAHGGSVTLTRGPLGGARFDIRLPPPGR